VTLRVLYLLTTPPPVVPGTDAVVQEVELLSVRFGGEVIWMRPSWRARKRYPRLLLGLHRLSAIREWDKHVDLHHVYAPQLYLLPVLWFLKRPVVYTVTTGVGSGSQTLPTSFLRRFHAIVVPSRADLDALTRRGLTNAHLVRPGIDVTRFVDTPVPPGPEFVLLSGSAPWTREQLRTKGVDTLLEVARDMRDLRLVFLWRGVLLPELVARVTRLQVSERVEILRDRVDVSRVLARVHAAVVLAGRPGLVRAYPHSLLEALATGRPVVMSDGNPMAEHIRETGCGRVVSGLEATDLIEAIQQLRQNYEAYQARARAVGRRDFSLEKLVTAHRDLYQALSA
jgi:glycosyltransferase involved in cell wall biosynthesis